MAALRENYQQPAKVSKDDSTIAADSQVVNCDRFSHRRLVHILHQRGHRAVSDLVGQERAQKGTIQKAQLKHIPSQYVPIDRHINNSVQVKLVVHQNK